MFVEAFKVASVLYNFLLSFSVQYLRINEIKTKRLQN